MNQIGKTLVLGASTNPSRYANRAILNLVNKGFEVVAVGHKPGEVSGIPIHTGQPNIQDLHTIALYLSPERQIPYYDYILSLKPKRIIFNPGTENVELIQLAKKNGIEADISCTLVLLAMDNY